MLLDDADEAPERLLLIQDEQKERRDPVQPLAVPDPRVEPAEGYQNPAKRLERGLAVPEQRVRWQRARQVELDLLDRG